MVTFFSCRSFTQENTYPFSQTERIEVLSYSSRTEWDSVDSRDFIIIDGKLDFDTSKIKQRIDLNKKDKERLFQFLFEDDCPFYGSIARCYEPRHLVLFYNSEGKLFNYFEVCLECGRAEGGFEYNDVCDERMVDLEAIFKEAGIKYFGEGED